MPECYCGRCFACAHALMVEQRRWRREREVMPGIGDYVQAHTGGDIRVVVRCYSAGDCLEAAADLRALSARTPNPLTKGL